MTIKTAAAAVWNSQPTAGLHGQSIVYDETTGKNIAIVYDGDEHAQLIAAAPELLEALERVWDSRHEPDKWSLEVSKALEKATGVTHPFRSACKEQERLRGAR